MIKSIVIILSSLIVGVNAFAQSKTTYRTLSSGEWNNPGIWQTSENGVQWTTAITAPDQQAGNIEIRATHKVTITNLIVTDQLLIADNAEIQIKPSGILLIQNLTSIVDLRVQGRIINEGTFMPINGALIFFEDQSSFVHHRNGGSIPAAQWSQNSTIQINAVSDQPVSGLDQRFGTLIWNSTNRVPISLEATQVQGSLIIQNGSPTHPFWLRPSSGTLYIAGDLILSDPAYVVFGGDSPQELRINGQFAQNGGVFEIVGEAQEHHIYPQGDFLHLGGRIRTTGKAHTIFTFSNPEGHQISSGGLVEGDIRYEVTAGANISFSEPSSILTGRSFSLFDDAHLEVSAPRGISLTAMEGHIQTTERFYAENAHYYYTGHDRQYSGDGLPQRIRSLTIGNPLGLELTGARTVTISDLLLLASGSLITNSSTIALEASAQLLGANEQRYVIGSLQLAFPVSVQHKLEYPIGDQLRYCPITVTLNYIAQEGSITASTTELSDVPKLSSGAMAEHYVDRQWILSGDETHFESYTVKLNYTKDEQVGFYFPDSVWVREYIDGKWTIVEQSMSSNQTLIVGPLTHFSAYMIGWDDDVTTSEEDNWSIIGLVYEDENANGLSDPEEAPRSGVTVELRTTDFQIIATTQTNDNGWFSFQVAEPGTYKIVIQVPEDRMLSTTASAAITLELTEANLLTRLEIGLYQPLQLEGKIDLGPQSDRYTTEAILIYGYFRGTLGMPPELPNTVREGELAQFSDTLSLDGSYRISGIRPGHYLIHLVLPPYWKSSTPTLQLIEVRKDALISLEFTAQLDEQKAPLLTNGVISGIVFEEIVQLGSRQVDVEPTLKDVKLTLIGNDVRGAPIERTTRTDNQGFYRFERLPEGFYQVKVHAEKPFQSTFPEAARHRLYIKGSEKIGHSVTTDQVHKAHPGNYPIYGYLRLGLDTLLNNQINALISFSGQGNIALESSIGTSRTLKLLHFTAIDEDSNGVRSSIRLPGVNESFGEWQSGRVKLSTSMEMSHRNKIYQVTDTITLSGFVPLWPLQHTVLVHYPDRGKPIVNLFGETTAYLRSVELVTMSGLDFGLFNLENLDSVILPKKIPTSPPITQETLPREISLGQNYPNPFNPSTMIPFSLPSMMPVKLQVFDVTGRLLQVLLNETKSAGRHEIIFKAGDLPSGVYFVTLEAGGKVFTKKISLLK